MHRVNTAQTTSPAASYAEQPPQIVREKLANIRDYDNIECTHIFALDRDFSKLNSDKEVSKHVAEILNRLKTFKVAVHPRIRLFYQLLKRGMSDYAQKTSDSLYNSSVYRKHSDNIL